jgi:acetylornithine/N-succinyldiaminopimelate aminotransferase
VVPNGQAQAAALAEGLLTVAAGENVLRLAPPLIIGRAECDAALELLEKTAVRLTPAKTEVLAK